MVNADAVGLFHGQMLWKKMKKNTWKEYWVELRENSLVFINENERRIVGVITLTERATCQVLGRKTTSSQLISANDRQSISDCKQRSLDASCKFKLRAKKGVHLLRTDCKSSCEKWIEAISRVVQNMWDNSANSVPSMTMRLRKHSFKNGKSRHGKDTITNDFSYSSLSEEDDDVSAPERLEGNHRKATESQHAILRGFMSAKGKLGKWIINFPSHVSLKGKSTNYGVLVEDTTD